MKSKICWQVHLESFQVPYLGSAAGAPISGSLAPSRLWIRTVALQSLWYLLGFSAEPFLHRRLGPDSRCAAPCEGGQSRANSTIRV
jgi:hypothetical protein